jgi:histidyl-tRNA synthetase
MAVLEGNGLPSEGVPDYFITGHDLHQIVEQARSLRKAGCSVEVEVAGRSLEASIAYASRKGIPHIVVVD